METFTSGGAPGLGYPDSLDSSPRSRGGESWDEPFLSSAPSKLRLMCSYGGRIVPRPTDKSLCYLGGETRIVVVERLSTLSELSARLSRSILGGRPFTLKYQLPNEDLDSLISVTTDEDLENMIEEYDRIAASNPAAVSGGSTRSSRLRVFVFPSKSESAPSSMTSLLDDSKSDTWFVDALNGAMGMGMESLPRGFLADSASVNCLLGLDDDSSVHSRGSGAAAAAANAVATSEPEQRLLPRPDSSGKLARHGQEIHSVPDSPMLDTSSSFGSTSSAPSLSNLPPTRVLPDDSPPDQRIGGLEDHFAQMTLSAAAAAAAAQRQEEVLKEAGLALHLPPPPPHTLPPASTSAPTISPPENPNWIFSSDDEKSVLGGGRKPQLPPQRKPTPVDAPISDSVTRTVYYQEKSSSAAANPISVPKQERPISDPSYRAPPIQAPDSGYVLPPVQPEQLQQQHHHQQQQQFVQSSHHYVHPATGAVLPIPPYYQMPYPIQQSQQQSHQFDPQVPMYFLPMRPNPQIQQSQQLPNVPAKHELAANLYRTAAAAAPLHPGAQPQLVHMAADQGYPYAGMGYHLMQQRHPSQSAAVMANYGGYGDQAHQPQVYYTQTTSAPPPLPPQYQMLGTDAAPAAPQLQPGEMKQTRAS